MFTPLKIVNIVSILFVSFLYLRYFLLVYAAVRKINVADSVEVFVVTLP